MRRTQRKTQRDNDESTDNKEEEVGATYGDRAKKMRKCTQHLEIRRKLGKGKLRKLCRGNKLNMEEIRNADCATKQTIEYVK